jgi:hypothetical protein
MFRLQLGIKAKDKITGFEGIITGRVEYLTGCHQYLLNAPSKDSDVKTAWFDDGRLDATSRKPIALVANAPNGPDKPAPAR